MSSKNCQSPSASYVGLVFESTMVMRKDAMQIGAAEKAAFQSRLEKV